MRLLPHFTLVMRKGQPDDEFKIAEGFILVLQWAKGASLIFISYLIKPRSTDKTGCCERDHGSFGFLPFVSSSPHQINAYTLCCNVRYRFKNIWWSWQHWFDIVLSKIFSNGNWASKPHLLVWSGLSLPSPEEKRKHCLGKTCPDRSQDTTSAPGLLASCLWGSPGACWHHPAPWLAVGLLLAAWWLLLQALGNVSPPQRTWIRCQQDSAEDHNSMLALPCYMHTWPHIPQPPPFHPGKTATEKVGLVLKTSNSS